MTMTLSVSLSAAMLICYEPILTVSPQVIVCEESTEGVELELLSGTHYPHDRLKNMSCSSLFFLFHSFGLYLSLFTVCQFAFHDAPHSESEQSEQRGLWPFFEKERKHLDSHSLTPCSSTMKRQKKILKYSGQCWDCSGLAQINQWET